MLNPLNLHHARLALVLKALNTRPTKSRAAKALGITYRTLRNYEKEFDITVERDGYYKVNQK